MIYKLFSISLLVLISLSSTAQEITHFQTFWGSAYYEDGESVDMSYIDSVMKTDPTSEEHWKKFKRNRNAFIVTGIAQIGFTIWMLEDIFDDDFGRSSDLDIVPVVGATVSLVAGLVFQLRALKFQREAIHSYNRTFDVAETSYISPSREGLGIALNF